MPFPKSAAAKGGRAAASALQKRIAAETIVQSKPWERSSGAKSEFGKAITSQNAFQATAKWRIREKDVADFAVELARIEGMLAQLEVIAEKHTFRAKRASLKVVISQSLRTGSDRLGGFASIAVGISTVMKWEEIVDEDFSAEMDALEEAARAEIRGILHTHAVNAAIAQPIATDEP